MKKPNILHLFTDQQRFDTIHALGNPIIRTPNLDRLCREGTVFTNAFTPSPVCISARCSMTHGQYPQNTGCYANAPRPDDGHETFMQALTRSGYRTAGIGKCHFEPGLYDLHGFEQRLVQEEFVPDETKDDYRIFLKERGYTDSKAAGGEMYYVPRPSHLKEDEHLSHWTADRSIEFIQNNTEDDSSWYLFSSFIDPHPPFTPPAPWHKLYNPLLMPLPKVPQDSEAHQTWINIFQNRYKCRDQGVDQYLQRCMKAYYYASISFIDYQIGRILDALEETGQLDNTLIVFTSDHGEYLGDYNCYGKRSMHDVSARIPMICRWPEKFEAGQQITQPVSLVDLAPTFLDVAVAELSTHEMDGESLIDVATGGVSRKTVYSQYSRGGSAIYMAVSERWKYIYSAADQKEMLFDRVNDPDELRNQAGIGLLDDICAAMRTDLIDYLRSAGETEGLDGDQWKTFDGFTPGPEWRWWNVKTPDQFGGNPDESYIMLPKAYSPELPEEYLNSPRL